MKHNEGGLILKVRDSSFPGSRAKDVNFCVAKRSGNLELFRFLHLCFGSRLPSSSIFPLDRLMNGSSNGLASITMPGQTGGIVEVLMVI